MSTSLSENKSDKPLNVFIRLLILRCDTMLFFLQRPRSNRSSWNISSPSDIKEYDQVNVCELVDIYY